MYRRDLCNGVQFDQNVVAFHSCTDIPHPDSHSKVVIQTEHH